MAEVVLDASALLAYVNGEAGAEMVAAVIGDSLISAVNYAEAATKLIHGGASPQATDAILHMADVEVVDFDRALAFAAGRLAVHTKSFGLSLGDRACLALCARERLPALTGDRIWRELKLNVEVRLIR